MVAKETGTNEEPMFDIHDLDEKTPQKVPTFLCLFQSPTRNQNPFK